jgi:putative transposase
LIFSSVYANLSLVLKNFKYRIYPTPSQKSKLNFTLNHCKIIYNKFLEERVDLYKNSNKSVTCYDQIKQLKNLKVENPDLKLIHSQVLQNVAERLDLAFKAFFRRIKRKETPGFPRFKSINRYSSFTYTQSGYKISNDFNRIFLSKIGHVKLIYHRPIEGKVKRCTVSRTSTNKWYVILSCDLQSDPPKISLDSNNLVGIDVGIKTFATLSDKNIIKNPKFFKEDKKQLAKIQRRYSKNKTKKNKLSVAKVHERIKNRRDNFSHQESRRLVNKYDYLVIEDLSINRMREDAYKILNSEISDASWNSFIEKLSYKAEYAGKKVIKINPAYTSQDCSKCGYRVTKKLSDREHNCPNCKIKMDRDLNASINIKALGQQSLLQLSK